jgi:hypothetical protein
LGSRPNSPTIALLVALASHPKGGAMFLSKSRSGYYYIWYKDERGKKGKIPFCLPLCGSTKIEVTQNSYAAFFLLSHMTFCRKNMAMNTKSNPK